MMTQKTISSLLRPLVVSGIYKDEKIALKDIIADYIQRKIEASSAVIKQMEKKYGKNFESVTKEMRNKATMSAEVQKDPWRTDRG